MRHVIREEAPEATEKISYQMPTFYLQGNLAHFASQKHHIGFYPTPSAIEAFKEELSAYKTSKGAVQFPLDKPIPYDLVRRMVRYRVEEATRAAEQKKAKNRGCRQRLVAEEIIHRNGGKRMNLDHLLAMLIPVLANLIESVGVVIIIYGCIKALYMFVKNGFNLNDSKPKLELAKALAFSLEFKLAAEILKTVVIQTIDEFIVLAAIVVLRVVLTLVIHWEIKSSEMDEGQSKKS